MSLPNSLVGSEPMSNKPAESTASEGRPFGAGVSDSGTIPSVAGGPTVSGETIVNDSGAIPSVVGVPIVLGGRSRMAVAFP